MEGKVIDPKKMYSEQEGALLLGICSNTLAFRAKQGLVKPEVYGHFRFYLGQSLIDLKESGRMFMRKPAAKPINQKKLFDGESSETLAELLAQARALIEKAEILIASTHKSNPTSGEGL